MRLADTRPADQADILPVAGRPEVRDLTEDTVQLRFVQRLDDERRIAPHFLWLLLGGKVDVGKHLDAAGRSTGHQSKLTKCMSVGPTRTAAERSAFVSRL